MYLTNFIYDIVNLKLGVKILVLFVEEIKKDVEI